MISTRRRAAAICVAVAAALVFASCGGDDDGGDAVPAGQGDAADVTTTSAAASQGDRVALGKTPLGDVLVDGDGRTLYVFTKDSGGKSSCSGGCAQTWPPFASSDDVAAGDGVDASKLGTTAREDGTTQVTYAGSPLYHYAADTSPGDTKGQGVGGVWFVVGKDGKAVTGTGTSTTTTSY